MTIIALAPELAPPSARRGHQPPEASSAPPGGAQQVLTVDTDRVVLTPETPLGFVRISNAGDGDLRWRAVAEDSMLRLDADGLPRPPGVLSISVASGTGNFDWGRSLSSTTVHLVDVSGHGHETREITVVIAPDTETAEAAGHVVRLAGATREETAVAISEAQHRTDRSAPLAFLARSDDFADALAGVPVAYALGAPLLLSRTDRVGDSTLTELHRVIEPDFTGRRRIILLGGMWALSATVEQQLRDEGFQVDRVAGLNRYDTAARIARLLRQTLDLEHQEIDRVFLTRGDDFPDALAAAPAAARAGAPILLTRGDRSAAETDEFLGEVGDVLRVAVGGHAARAYPQATPVVGAGREETAIAVARGFFGETPNSVALSRHDVFADALTGGVHAAGIHAPVLLTHSTRLHPAVQDYLEGLRLTTAALYGGTAALSAETAREVAAATGLRGP